MISLKTNIPGEAWDFAVISSKKEVRIRGFVSGLGLGWQEEAKEEEPEHDREDKESELELVGTEYEHSELATRSRE